MASVEQGPAKSGESVLLLGATGSTGRHVLKELLESKHWTRVIEAGRKVTSADILQGLTGKEKLVQKTIDFENLDTSGLKDERADAVVIVLGTTRAAAGSAENFTKIDKDYVINAAKAAKTESDQRLLYLSSMSASASSFMLYTKSKGLTEQGLAGLGYRDLIVFRPGALKERADPKLSESILNTISDHLPGSSSWSISVKDVAKAISKAAELGSGNLPAAAAATVVQESGVPPYYVIPHKGALDLSRSS